MKEAVIVSTARTPIGKAYRGSFNNLAGATLGAASVEALVKRASIDPARVDDVILGCAFPEAEQGLNFARLAALLAALGSLTSLVETASLAFLFTFAVVCALAWRQRAG